MFAGFLFGVIFVGSLYVETTAGTPSAISRIIEALIILFLISGEVLKSYRFDIRLGAWSLQEAIRGLLGLARTEGN
jgi:ABC-type uncharacterized transport system permease subunit